MEYHFIVHGRPLVQKNNLNIYNRKIRGKLVPFIGHNQKLLEFRERVSEEIYEECKFNDWKVPIDYFIEIDLVYYITRQAEPDLDNLPAAILDALQGTDEGDGVKKNAVITDDKLVRKITAQKIVKGDKEYVGEPRTEVTIRRYNP